MLMKIVDAACGTIQVPKALVIQNRRLGFLFRILQIAAIIWVIYSIVDLKGYLIVSVPMPNSLEVWTTSQTSTAMAQNADYCSKALYYQYSDSYSFNMTKCVELPSGEEVAKLGTNIFVATAVQDRYVTRKENVGTDCNTLNTNCTAMGGTYKAGTVCECVRERQGFVKHPEDTHVHLNHGYIVTWPNGERFRGRDKASAELKGGPTTQWANVDGQSGEMRSIVQGPTGDRCKVGADSKGGAKDVWTKADVSADGLKMTIRELLACAGESLDLKYESLSSGLPDEQGQPIPRIAGMNIHLDFSYHNTEDDAHMIDGFDGVVCVITVSADARWNSAAQMAYASVPDMDTGAGEFRSRKSFGVSFTFNSKGSFKKFDLQALITLFVNSLVILTLPAAIVQFFALSACGVLSAVYKRAQAQVLNIDRQLSGLTSRMLGGMSSFQAVTGARDDATAGAQIDRDILKTKLKIAFHGPIKDGTLNEQEFEGLCDHVLATMDVGESGTVTFEEFLNAFASEECLEPKNMIRLFDKDRRRNPLEILFTPKDSKKARGGGMSGVKVVPKGE